MKYPNTSEHLITLGCFPTGPFPTRNTQHPSPIIPSTHTSPLSAREADPSLFNTIKSNLVPLPRFVHEVLWRSCTSGHILQTALCYIGALRRCGAELVDLDKNGKESLFKSESNSVILEGMQADITAASNDIYFNMQPTPSVDDSLVATVHVTDKSELDFQLSGSAEMLSSETGTSETLPSSLLCPRQALLASLILASKFMQDKSYSNQAWSKIFGLPAKEVTRCKQAMGDTFGWRLWAGKAPVVDTTSSITAPLLPVPAAGGRTLSRCQSENATGSSNISRSTFLVAPEGSLMLSSSHFRRSATLPNGELFARQPVQREANWEASSISQDLPSVSIHCIISFQRLISLWLYRSPEPAWRSSNRRTAHAPPVLH